MSCKHREAQAVQELWDEGQQRFTSLSRTPGGQQGASQPKHTVLKKNKKKGFLNVARKHFYPPLKFGIMSACWYLVVEEEEKKKQS